MSLKVGVGTPPQLLQVQFYTQGSDTYFFTSDACKALSNSLYPCVGSAFSPSDSSTYAVTQAAPAFSVTYGDNSTVSGPYATDTIAIDGQLLFLEDVPFGVVQHAIEDSGPTYGAIGLGYSSLQGNPLNFVELLRDSGVISSRLFSLYLGGASVDGSGYGTVLFGGIDPARYQGEFTTLNIINGTSMATGVQYDYVIPITSIDAVNSSTGIQTTIFPTSGDPQNYSSIPSAVWLESPFWALPHAAFNQLLATTFFFVDDNGNCACSHQNDSVVLRVTFGGEATVDVPMRDLLVPVYNTTTGTRMVYANGTGVCNLALSYSDQPEDIFSLGSSILRSMYVVVDLDNAQVSVAQAVRNTYGSDEQDTRAVGAGPNEVASAAHQTASAVPNTFYIPNGTSTSLSISTPGPTVSTISVGTLSNNKPTSTVGTVPTSSTTKSAGSSVFRANIPEQHVGLFILAFSIAGIMVG